MILRQVCQTSHKPRATPGTESAHLYKMPQARMFYIPNAKSVQLPARSLDPRLRCPRLKPGGLPSAGLRDDVTDN